LKSGTATSLISIYKFLKNINFVLFSYDCSLRYFETNNKLLHLRLKAILE
jgi:hypothetical protein